MRLLRKVLVALLLMASVPAAASAHGGFGWGLGLGLGLGVPLGVGLSAPLYRPYYYAPPYPVYVAPPPVVVQQAPVYVQPAPASQPTCRPQYQPAYTANTAEPPYASEVTAASAVSYSPGLQTTLDQLTSADPGTRAAACLALGRLRAAASVGPLIRLLQGDGDPAVRESAARGLGLIAHPASLTALEQAAQADSDRDVRHSASFAAEVIRAHHTHPR